MDETVVTSPAAPASTPTKSEDTDDDNGVKVPESPKPLAFTIDFGAGKSVDTQRHKALVEKFQNRHRRGQSLSKLEDSPASSTGSSTNKKHPSTGNLPRKSSFQSEGYFSSDEKSDRCKNVRSNNVRMMRAELTLPLKNLASDKMTQSFPNGSFNLATIKSPELELKDVSSPELDLVSPFSPNDKLVHHNKQLPTPSPMIRKKKLLLRQFSSPEVETRNFIVGQSEDSNKLVDAGGGGDGGDFDRSDTVSDAGTYTLETDNYTEEQKARMSIDQEFNIEQVSVMKKTEEYIRSLSNGKERPRRQSLPRTNNARAKEITHLKPKEPPQVLQINQKQLLPSPKSPNIPLSPNVFNQIAKNACTPEQQKPKLLSPIMSPTQNMSITDVPKNQNKIKNDDENYEKILYPSPKSKTGIGIENSLDQGCFTSVTSSGAFSRRSEVKEKGHVRQPSLTKSEIQVQMYVDTTGGSGENSGGIVHAALTVNRPSNGKIIESQDVSKLNEKIKNNIDRKSSTESDNYEPVVVHGNLQMGKVVSTLPPAVGGISGKNSPTKIPSPVHTALSRPRSRNSVSSLNIDLSDSSLETESFLKPTQNYINSLQKRLSLDSDQDSDYDNRCNLRLNNETQDLLKQKSMHVRHNSFDDKNLKISNKLEHFQNKNLQGIDQTYTNKLNQYSQQNKVVHKIQNSPNNSPIRRSSSFSTNKNQFINVQPKVTNLNSSGVAKDTNIRNSPNLNRNGSIQRSASTASIKPNLLQLRRSSINTEHTKIDRNQFADTESSSEDDFEKNLLKKKDFSNLTNTRYNRAFSLRRARLDNEPPPQPKCPNTPEMRRKFQPSEHVRSERAISVDRRPIKTNEVPSRYLQNITKTKNVPEKAETPKNVPKVGSNVIKSLPGKPQVFSRTDSGRFSMRTSKPLTSNTQKSSRKDGGGKKQSGGRSNSSLSSREVEFQNWKRRKSYDPMKAAAEGKKKAEMAKKQNQNIMTQSFTENNQSQDCDSSPSHSSSVHRSQSFHGTAALEQLISSEEDDLTLSADEGFSPPTPSPCELSPARTKLRQSWRDRLLH